MALWFYFGVVALMSLWWSLWVVVDDRTHCTHLYPTLLLVWKVGCLFDGDILWPILRILSVAKYTSVPHATVGTVLLIIIVSGDDPSWTEP
mmetsp:Transcript_29504/g.63730  ORF Transcript_29504/g.63730 Transcript_29504/m.63730 type:complete len:91 (+) Transcript_29504:196-468(+)